MKKNIKFPINIYQALTIALAGSLIITAINLYSAHKANECIAHGPDTTLIRHIDTIPAFPSINAYTPHYHVNEDCSTQVECLEGEISLLQNQIKRQ